MSTIRAPRLPVPPKLALRNWARVLFSGRLWHALWVKMGHDRVLMRGSSLAFDTLLAVVPLAAVIMAATRALGGSSQQDALVHYLAVQYVPASAGAAVDRVLPLIDGLDLRTIGIVGLIALLPVIFSLVDAVEGALSDIFSTPRRNHWWRLLVLGGLLTLAPLGSLLTVRYVPWSAIAVDQVVTPLVAVTALFFWIFRKLPSARISNRAAFSGALTAGILLSLAKVGFGLYATHLSQGLHLLWGAIAFVPLLLVWVLLVWCIVLLGAELAATLERVLSSIEQPHLGRQRAFHRRSRLRRRIARHQVHPK